MIVNETQEPEIPGKNGGLPMSDPNNELLPSPNPLNAPTDLSSAADPEPAAPPSPPAFSAEPLLNTLRRFLACNPLYLISAALLLYSFYLVSVDRNFLGTEVSQLTFDLGSLQMYEALVVCTAIFLARRAVWYDSTLLVGLENLLVLVPFILISQAALINMRLVWFLCCGVGLLAAVRFGLLKRFIHQLNAPPRTLVLGIVMLAVNIALPIVYRILQESKFGTKPDWGAAYHTNQFVWWLLCPALCALSSLVPWKRVSTELWPQRGWLPLGLFSLWLTGTGVHLYCLDYVYDFELRPDLLAPAIWALAWAFSLRVPQWLPDAAPAWRSVPWILPAVTTLLATEQTGKQVFLALTLANIAIYLALYLRRRAPLALHLLLLSVVALVGGLPETWGQSLVAEFSRQKFIFAAGSVYLLGCISVLRDPKLGLVGGIWAAIVAGVIGPESSGFHWGVQAGLAYLLLHSLRWTESRVESTRLVRWIIAAAWVIHGAVWTQCFDGGWRAGAVALPVLAIYLLFRLLTGNWGPLVVVVATLLVLLSAPGHVAAVHVRSTPSALLAVIGSFILFVLGTLLALTKKRWLPRA